MDWARDTVGLSDSHLSKVFKYAPSQSTIIQVLATKRYEAEITTLDEENGYDLLATLPSRKRPDSGLILLLAKRVGEPSCPVSEKLSPEEWLRSANGEGPTSQNLRKNTFLNLTEKPSLGTAPTATVIGNRRGVRTLPFSCEVFDKIAQSFYTHPSIARVISRTDVPVFSSNSINIPGPTCVYNCRSSNAWDMDLALSVTYIPEYSLTFAILYGCTARIEKDIVKRIAGVKQEAMHPILMPGIFAELEHSRHMRLVKKTVATLETRIFEVDIDLHSDNMTQTQRAKRDERNIQKRTAWLDTAYLRNGLISWSTQIQKMIQSLDETEASCAGMSGKDSSSPLASVATIDGQDIKSPNHENNNCKSCTCSVSDNSAPENEGEQAEKPTIHSSPILDHGSLRVGHIIAAGNKMKGRLAEIHEEYEDWIRDCTIRVDGMAMANQWAQGDTNVEIALATKRDSKYMRSIALLTMVFLPGTFLAGVFSMSFFDWNSSSGASVSSYFWIYVVITISLTLVTVGSWYLFVVYRPRWQANNSENED